MPDLPLYLLQLLLLPGVLNHIFEILHFLFLRLVAVHPSYPSNVINVSPSSPHGGHVSFSRPSPKLGITELSDCTHLATNFDQHQDHLSDVTQHLQEPATASQKSLPSERLAAPPRQHSPQPQERIASVLVHDSRNVFVDGTMNTVTYTNTVISGANNFMEKLLEKTISGAAFNSSARDPPPRCHPGTRLAVIERCIHFIVNSADQTKMCWVVGAAGVGKSAIMQSIAEYALPSIIWRASIFFFVDGRSDGTKAIVTLAYQLAVQSEPYHQFIEGEITRDPSLFQSSMAVQFSKFVIEPFVHHPLLSSAGRVLMMIDGLDECDQSRTQRELLRLISDFCLTYPSSPIVWIISSRPEVHITSFFVQASVEAVYEKEEILVDSIEAREDVEIFLRIELGKIQNEFSLNPKARWPSYQDFWKLANTSGGLFVYAHTVIKYISDPDIGDPILQLNDVLQVIDAHALPDVPREEHPMALLDALYSRILSKIPTKVMENARKLLLALVVSWEHLSQRKARNFILLCNWLGMTCDDAYAALRPLNSVLYIPGRDEAHKEQLRYLHKSFIDYITRSGFFSDLKREAHELYVQCTFRILQQAPDGIDVGDLDYFVCGLFPIGTLGRGPGTGGNISLTWLVDEKGDWDDNRTRLCMYKMAFVCVVFGIVRRQDAFATPYCIHLLITRFQTFFEPGVRKLHRVVFGTSCRHELMERGQLQQMPIKMLDFRHIKWHSVLQFRRPRTPKPNLSDPWNQSCTHPREGEWGEGKDQAWSTEFLTPYFGSRGCSSCFQRLEYQLENWKTRSPDHPVSVLLTSAGVGLVEFQFLDPEDGVSEWTYWFAHHDMFPREKCMQLGRIV